MGKRSHFIRKPRDFYPTPYKAVLPLLPHLAPRTRFAEPCVGDGALVRHLEHHGHTCSWGSDIEDRSAPAVVSGVEVIRKFPVADALTLTTTLRQADCIITNPPFSKEILFPLIEHLSSQNSTWLLLPADFMHNVGSAPFLVYCQHIISIGRVSWEENGVSGKDNHCWYHFDQNYEGPPATEFFGRQV